MQEEESTSLTATVNPSNATNKRVSWKSSNNSVATVDQSGNVRAVSPGTVTITVTTEDGNKQDSITITVKEKPANYVITFVGEKQEGSENVMQYTFSVTKNGTSFSDYKGFNLGGEEIRQGTKYVIASKLASKAGTAQLTLNNGTIVTATVYYR